MKKFFKKIGMGILFVFSFLWLYMKLFQPSTFLETPEILSHLYSKEICSCLFIENLTEKECLDIHAKSIKPSTLIIDREKKTVNAQIFYGVSKAHLVSEAEGCLVDY